MSWGRFDDLYDDSAKIEDAWEAHPRAVGLHAMAVTYCSRHETDSVVHPRWLRRKLPKEAERRRVLAVLVELNLFESLPAGERRELRAQRGPEVVVGPFREDVHLVHDYLDYNDSAAYLADRRTADAERKKRGRSPGVRAASERTLNGRAPDSERPSRTPGARPDPTRPDPGPPGPPPSGGRKRTQEAWKEEVVVWARAVGVEEVGNSTTEAPGTNIVKAYHSSRPWLADDPGGVFRDAAARFYSRALAVGDG